MLGCLCDNLSLIVDQAWSYSFIRPSLFLQACVALSKAVVICPSFRDTPPSSLQQQFSAGIILVRLPITECSATATLLSAVSRLLRHAHASCWSNHRVRMATFLAPSAPVYLSCLLILLAARTIKTANELEEINKGKEGVEQDTAKRKRKQKNCPSRRSLVIS